MYYTGQTTRKDPISSFCQIKMTMHLQLKLAKGLNHVAENEEDVAHAQGAQQGVEQGRH